jgi:hypothetical protein
MATTPRPALDAWLATADRVLADAHNASLSPSLAPGPWDDHRTEQPTTLAEFELHLNDLLTRLVYSPGRWVAIAEDDRGRFVQVLAFEDGSLIAEVVANNYLKGEDRWEQEDEAKLVALGWQPPCPPQSPNWRAVFPTVSPDIAEASALLVATLRTVFRLGGPDRVNLTLFCSPRREGTPASSLDPMNGESNALELARHREREDWHDDAWVAQLLRLLVAQRRIEGVGEQWTCGLQLRIGTGMFDGTVFVVEGPASTGFRCLGSRFRFGPVEAPDSPPLVKFYDAGDQRFRYIATFEPPLAADGVITWTNSVGDWRCRPLTNDDQGWVLLPGTSFDTFADFKAWAEWYSDSNLGQPVLFQ